MNAKESAPATVAKVEGLGRKILNFLKSHMISDNFEYIAQSGEQSWIEVKGVDIPSGVLLQGNIPDCFGYSEDQSRTFRTQQYADRETGEMLSYLIPEVVHSMKYFESSVVKHEEALLEAATARAE